MLVRKSFALLVILLLQSIMLFGQEWQLLTPIKNNSKIKAVAMVNDSTCFAIDMMEHRILKTTNNGEKWSRMYFYLSSQPYDMWMFDEMNGVICASSGYIYITHNGFQTYTIVTTGQGNLYSLWFTSDQIGYATGENGKVLKTTNGGSNWSLLSTGVSDIFFNVFFVDDTTGYACGNSGRIIKTIDGGTSWATLTTGTSTRITDVYFSDLNNGIAVGSGGLMLRTADAGATWTTASSPTNQYIFNITRSGSILMAACGGGVLLRSTDNGINWSSTTVGSRDHYMVSFASNGLGFSGSDANMYYTTDFGSSWSLHLGGIANSSLNKVSFANNNIGVAVGMMGGYNAIVRTTDGGRTWVNILANSASSSGLLGIHLLPNGMGCLGGSTGINAHTDNFGQTFTYPSIRPTVAVRAVWAFDEDRYILGGGYINAGFYKTTNGGATAFTYIPSGNVYDFYFPSDSIGYAVGEGGFVAKTTDQGNSWNSISTGYLSDNDCVYFVNDTIGYVGAGGPALKTTDGGVSWTAVYPAGTSVVSLIFCTPDSGYAITYNGYLLKTIDGGANWDLLANGLVDMGVNDAALVNGNIIAVGNMGDVYEFELYSCDNIQTPIIYQQGDTLFSNMSSGNQWYNSAGAIAGATDDHLLANVNDAYYVINTNFFGCISDTSNEIFVPCPIIAAPVITQSGDTLFSSAAYGNQWYNASGAIAGANDTMLVVSVSGDYYCIQSDSFACSSGSSNVLHVVISGFASSITNRLIKVYPIPSEGIIYIDLQQSEAIEIAVLDLQGKVLISQSSPNNRHHALDVSGLANGIYCLQCSGAFLNTSQTLFVLKR